VVELLVRLMAGVWREFYVGLVPKGLDMAVLGEYMRWKVGAASLGVKREQGREGAEGGGLFM